MAFDKCFITTLILLLPVNCLYGGDECSLNGKIGTCQRLTQCSSLYNLVLSTGIPANVRRRLQEAGCGFEGEEPLVCCSNPRNDSLMADQPSQSSYSQGNYNKDSSNFNHANGVESTTCEHRFHEDKVHEGNFETFVNAESNNNDNMNEEITTPPNVLSHRNLRLLPKQCGPIEDNRIWGGNQTALYEMPWMVLLAYNSGRGTKLSCGGTLITRWYVLTAAHCVMHLGSRLQLVAVILGEHDVRRDPDCERFEGELQCSPAARNVSIDSVIAHSGYTPQNLFDDIALIRLSEPADFNLDNMKPICLPTTPEVQTEELSGKQGVVAGWGATEDGLQSPILLSVDLPIISNEDCRSTYNGNPQIFARQMCAGGVPDKDSCGGDSGGPLMYPGRVSGGNIRYIQRGVVSFGSKRCGVGGFPGVYTRVAFYMDWILNNIRD